MSELTDSIKDVIENEPVALFMKGTPQFIMCGNSDRALRALRDAGRARDRGEHPAATRRSARSSPELSGWPTIPAGVRQRRADRRRRHHAGAGRERRADARARGEARRGLPRRRRGARRRRALARPAVADRRDRSRADQRLLERLARSARRASGGSTAPTRGRARRSARASAASSVVVRVEIRDAAARHSSRSAGPVRLGAGRAKHPVLPLVPVLRAARRCDPTRTRRRRGAARARRACRGPRRAVARGAARGPATTASHLAGTACYRPPGTSSRMNRSPAGACGSTPSAS